MFIGEDTSGAIAYEIFEGGKSLEKAEWESGGEFSTFESTLREEPELESVDDKFADEVRSGVGQVVKINQMTWEIINEVQGLSGRFQLVNEGMRNQMLGAQQINDAMAQIAEGTRRSVQSLQDFERATAHLRASVEGLTQEIAQFKT